MKLRSTGSLTCFVLCAALGCDKFSSNKDSSIALSASAPAGASSAAPAKLGSVSDFEGEVQLVVKSSRPRDKAIPPIALLIKERKVRVDLPLDAEQTAQLGGKVYVVLDPSEKKLQAVLDGRKQVVLLELDKAAEQLKALKPKLGSDTGDSEAKAPPPKIVKTGRKDRVIGRECEDWEITDPKKQDKVIVCIADEGSSWFRLPSGAVPAEYAWITELTDGKHFPLRVITYEGKKETARIELTKLEKRAVDAALFEIPKEYQVLSIEQAVQSFMAQAMGGGFRPGAAGAGMPRGFKLPPGVKLPPGFKLPPGMQPAEEPAK